MRAFIILSVASLALAGANGFAFAQYGDVVPNQSKAESRLAQAITSSRAMLVYVSIPGAGRTNEMIGLSAIPTTMNYLSPARTKRPTLSSLGFGRMTSCSAQVTTL